MLTILAKSPIFESPHLVKSARIRSFSGPYFSAFGLNTERYEVSLRIRSEFGEMRTRKTSNTDPFHALPIFGDYAPLVTIVTNLLTYQFCFNTGFVYHLSLDSF